jgi:hypothetical protein
MNLSNILLITQRFLTINGAYANMELTIYINIFLNDRCHNAYDIKKFIASIDFSKENFEKIIKEYVGSNAAKRRGVTEDMMLYCYLSPNAIVRTRNV